MASTDFGDGFFLSRDSAFGSGWPTMLHLPVGLSSLKIGDVDDDRIDGHWRETSKALRAPKTPKGPSAAGWTYDDCIDAKAGKRRSSGGESATSSTSGKTQASAARASSSDSPPPFYTPAFPTKRETSEPMADWCHQCKTVTVQCFVHVKSRDIAAEVVGKGGKNLKILQSRTACSFHAPRDNCIEQLLIFTVCGKDKASVELAESELHGIVANVTRLQDDRLAFAKPKHGESTRHLAIPTGLVAVVVGAEGSVINDIANKHDVRILSPKEHHDAIFHVVGKAEAAKNACQDIVNWIYEKTRGKDLRDLLVHGADGFRRATDEHAKAAKNECLKLCGEVVGGDRDGSELLFDLENSSRIYDKPSGPNRRPDYQQRSSSFSGSGLHATAARGDSQLERQIPKRAAEVLSYSSRYDRGRAYSETLPAMTTRAFTKESPTSWTLHPVSQITASTLPKPSSGSSEDEELPHLRLGNQFGSIGDTSMRRLSAAGMRDGWLGRHFE